MKNQTIRIQTTDQALAIGAALVQGVPANLPFNIAQAWNGSKGELHAVMAAVLRAGPQYPRLRREWEKFYDDVFSIEIDLSPEQLSIPVKQPGFDRLIVVAPGITAQRVFDKCVKLFPCWSYYDDLDKAVSHSDRVATNSPYAVWLRSRQEADKELEDKSAVMLQEEKIPGITLLERLLFELVYFRESGEHLDIERITLCSGSRDSDGGVPGACWPCGQFGVHGFDLGARAVALRSRQAVS